MVGNTKTFGAHDTFTVATTQATDMSSVESVYTRQLLNSLFFKPYSTRSDIIFPKRFEGVLFCFMDPDMFKISGGEDWSENIEDATPQILIESGIAVPFPDPDGEDYYIIKSGGNEDGTALPGFSVSFVPIEPDTIADSSTSNPFNPLNFERESL